MEMTDTRLKVLVVDDEPALLRFIRIWLDLAGFDVTTTTSGQEALDLIRQNSYAIMLLDVYMEPVSGLDVLKRLGPARKLPVIVFSAGASVVDKAVGAGADAFIAKPFKPEQLVAKIKEVISRPRVK